MAGSTFDQLPRGRHTISLLVLGIVVVSLLVQRLVAGSNRVSVPLEPPVPTIVAPASPANTATAPPTATSLLTATPVPPTATVAPSFTSTSTPPTTPTRPPPSPSATAVAATPTPVATASPTRPAAPPSPGPTPRPGARTVRIIRDAQSRPALLRARPDVGALVIGEIPADTVLEVLGEEKGQAVVAGNNVWYRVTYGGRSGYVYAALATP